MLRMQASIKIQVHTKLLLQNEKSTKYKFLELYKNLKYLCDIKYGNSQNFNLILSDWIIQFKHYI